jgi:hypothetical protein
MIEKLAHNVDVAVLAREERAEPPCEIRATACTLPRVTRPFAYAAALAGPVLTADR